MEIMEIQWPSLSDDIASSRLPAGHYNNKDLASSWLTMDSAWIEQLKAPTTTAAVPSLCRHHYQHHSHQYENVIENLALVNAVDNLKELFSLFDGSTYKKKSLGQEFFVEAFERVFDKSTIASAAATESTLELQSYQKSLEEHIALFNAGVRADIVEFKLQLQQQQQQCGVMMIEYTVQAILKNGREYAFEAMAVLNTANGKLVVLVDKGRHAGQVLLATPQDAAQPAAAVSGQVDACPLAARVSCNFPTECQLSHQNGLPLVLRDSLPLFCPDLLPTETAGTVIKICLVARATRPTTITPSPFSSFCTGTASSDAQSSKANSNKRLARPTLSCPRQALLKGRGRRINIRKATNGSPYADGVWLEESKQPLYTIGAGGPVFTLRNQHDIPIAQCIPDHTTTTTTRCEQRQERQRKWWAPSSLGSKKANRPRACRRAYNIMGRRPLHEGDLPTPSQFYPWYRVETNKNEAMQHSFCSILFWNGSRYEPYMTTVAPLADAAVTSSASSCTTTLETAMDDDLNTSHGTDHGRQHQPLEQYYSHGLLFSSSIKNDADLEPTFSYGYLACKQHLAATSSSLSATSAAAPGPTWDLTIAPNVDPAMMICLAAVTRELFKGSLQ